MKKTENNKTFLQGKQRLRPQGMTGRIRDKMAEMALPWVDVFLETYCFPANIKTQSIYWPGKQAMTRIMRRNPFEFCLELHLFAIRSEWVNLVQGE